MIGNPYMFTLGQAAKHLGISKPTLSKAIKTGKLSATRHDDGSFAIDPSELERYRAANGHRFQAEPVDALRPATPVDNALELVETRARMTLAEERLADLKAALDDMRAERDKWQEQAARLAIADHRPARPRGILAWLKAS